MTVQELIAALQRRDPEAVVMIPADHDGADFAVVSKVAPDLAVPDPTVPGALLLARLGEAENLVAVVRLS